MIRMMIDLQIEAVACTNCGERRIKEVTLEEDDLVTIFKEQGSYFFI